MLGPRAAAGVLPATFDEIRKRTAEPRHRDLAVRMESREQIRPAALVAAKPPSLDQIGAGLFVGNVHGETSGKTAARAPATGRPARKDSAFRGCSSRRLH